jgi:hypothetical protein
MMAWHIMRHVMPCQVPCRVMSWHVTCDGSARSCGAAEPRPRARHVRQCTGHARRRTAAPAEPLAINGPSTAEDDHPPFLCLGARLRRYPLSSVQPVELGLKGSRALTYKTEL